MIKRDQNFFGAKKGFTLLEILLVIVLVALLATAVVPRVTSIFRVSVQSSVRRYAALVRYAYDNAILTGRLHRIVLNLDDQTWRLEAAEVGQLPLEKVKDSYASNQKDEKDKDKEGDGFKKVGDGLVDKIPNGVKILEVSSWRVGETPVSTGEICIYSYPSGFIDESTVVIAQLGKENEQKFKVSTKSLTGRVNVEVETRK